ncbi:hypothetical protein LTR78_008374 [Recurvomyces mirabilis]|uniref:CBF1-interacting co-repressor CIR N-terminal domain-containing protein n=1 Tax=Recurvomyces mirabilis TaxID=574656 RepID=A0AAE0TUW9_9PEZI|nr:hypothetical protein LTR78_008374 [Recurvomyces mirabilis]
MPLHLLGKKSWHVYNTANVERVRRDEADAQAREEAEEQRMQEEDASRRIAILRGEKPAAAALPPPSSATEEAAGIRHDRPRERKRRRLRDEDDTAREIRYAREDAEEAGQQARRALEHSHVHHSQNRDADAPLVDHAGHLQLIPVPDEKASSRKAGKNAEVEAEKAKKRKRKEDQVTMRFSNAAGYQQGLQKPWYASNKRAKPDADPASASAEDGALTLTAVQEKDVWGNDDPRRKERERSRISSSDPFAAMQNAQKQLKQSTRDKEKWELEQYRELEKLKREQRGERKHRRHHHHP